MPKIVQNQHKKGKKKLIKRVKKPKISTAVKISTGGAIGVTPIFISACYFEDHFTIF